MTVYKPEGQLIDTPENRESLKSLQGLKEAMLTGRILEARATVCDGEHNLIVDLGGIRGIIPHNEGALGIAEGTTRDIAIISRVNKPVCFRILSITGEPGQEPVIRLSRRAVQKECMERYIQTLSPGDIIPARITHLEPFGCFVDIGCGVASLIPIDSISVSRISHPQDRFNINQDIYAVVKGIDPDGRVSLSHKELLGTWEENAALFASGETVAGIIRSVEEYGVFVELTTNLAGLAEPRFDVKPGQHASVYIKSLIPEKMKVKLIIVDAFDAAYPAQLHKYFVTGTHIDRWQYSPPASPKKIETVFEEEPIE